MIENEALLDVPDAVIEEEFLATVRKKLSGPEEEGDTINISTDTSTGV